MMEITFGSEEKKLLGKLVCVLERIAVSNEGLLKCSAIASERSESLIRETTKNVEKPVIENNQVPPVSSGSE